jgi:Xaa-Pro aminopeptidase
VPTPALLLYADSAHNADALYFGRVHVPDPFIAIGHNKKKIAVINALEFGRVKKESAFDTVLPLEKYLSAAREKAPGQKVGAAEVIALVGRELGIKTFVIPDDFPAGLANRLTGLGVRLELADGPVLPKREIKTPDEAAAIREGNRCSALGIGAAESVLRASKIVSGKLHYRGAPLTAERLKFSIETACLEAGALSIDTIAAGGDQACDPHHRGCFPPRTGHRLSRRHDAHVSQRPRLRRSTRARRHRS